MEKPAETTYPIHDLLRRRWSPRAFSDRMVEAEQLQSLFEAARWAPSSFNEQPWSFIIATREDPIQHRMMLECLVEGNIGWAQHAPVLMITVAKLAFNDGGEPNRHAFHDVGLAVANFVVQATTLGLAVHQMAGLYPGKARDIYRIPEGYEAVTAIALGYPGDPEQLPETLRARELARRERKSIHEFVFADRWNQTAPFI